ncbi:MAG: spermidine/putrescine ABC transporter substrate-binding protein PotD [Thiothrix lacustris]|uniref:Putrescine-binding periplasmic protein n=1 Tax=Thiothrix lacustris TaxID=525917 RepID=A0A1Y1QDV0_9GAMM|nr:MAG: spermidine/putrescine ABC transporter substrate-binding protein PotD [Thiothrix lacustris]
MQHIILGIFLTSVLMLPVQAAGADRNTDIAEETVIVYNWSDYIPDGVLEDFTRETGIKVEYLTYKNNEIMYTKLKLLKGRGYDVLVPSTYMVERLRKDGLLQPLNKTLLGNFKQLDPDLLNKPYDPGNEVSVPYLWGSVGLGVNTSNPAAANVSSWADLWHKQWRDKLLLLDDMRGVFHMALRLDGYSTNSTAPEEIKQAYERLQKLMPNVRIFGEDKANEPFETGAVDLGTLWNGDAILAKSKNPAIRYVYPKEGASFWLDSFVIPARASNPENAHKFIDYMLRPEVAVRCVKELGYATPNAVAKAMLDAETRDDPTIFPSPELVAKAEFQRDIGDALELYTRYWAKLKADH